MCVCRAGAQVSGELVLSVGPAPGGAIGWELGHKLQAALDKDGHHVLWADPGLDETPQSFPATEEFVDPVLCTPRGSAQGGRAGGGYGTGRQVVD
eukprot:COSAG01_NODE_9373_length_2464_cov_2.379704_2_plen_95_part_00